MSPANNQRVALVLRRCRRGAFVFWVGKVWLADGRVYRSPALTNREAAINWAGYQ